MARADLTKATGTNARAEGDGTSASGSTSHAEGASTTASGTRSHAEGSGTNASASYSHAEGSGTTASGSASHAEGQNTLASDATAHAEGHSTQATGTYSHAEGFSCVASGSTSHAEGGSSTAAGTGSHAEGYSTANGTYAHSEGYATIAGGNYSHASGNQGVASRLAQRAQGGVLFAVAGDGQANAFVAGISTTDATPAVLTFNASATKTLTGAATNVLTIPVNRAHQFRVSVVARRSDVSGDTAGWVFEGLAARGSSGDAAFVGTVDGRAWGAAGAAAWDVTLTVNTGDATNNYLAVTATGEAAKTIRWVATIETTEVG
jgi:hypothetical protein